MLLPQALFLLATALVSLLNNGQSIVRLHVAVAACQRYAEARHGAVHPLIVAKAQNLPQPVAGSALSQFDLLRDALADNERSLDAS